MGAFRVDIDICRPGRRSRWVSVRQVLVDSGSWMTWLPERLLRSIGIDVFKRDQRFVMANGLEITRDVGVAVIRSGDFKTVDEVVFGRTGDLARLGAHTLEGFNASVDARRKRLVPSGPILVAGGGRVVVLARNRVEGFRCSTARGGGAIVPMSEFPACTTNSPL